MIGSALADASGSKNDPMPLYLLSKERSTDVGAVCLDGTPPGFYASFSNDTSTKTSWLLYFKGNKIDYSSKSYCE